MIALDNDTQLRREQLAEYLNEQGFVPVDEDALPGIKPVQDRAVLLRRRQGVALSGPLRCQLTTYRWSSKGWISRKPVKGEFASEGRRLRVIVSCPVDTWPS